MIKTTNNYSPEVRERAVRMVLDNQGQHDSRWSAILSISSKIGCAPQTLNEWVKKAEVDRRERGGISTEQAEKMKALQLFDFLLKRKALPLTKARTRFALGHDSTKRRNALEREVHELKQAIAFDEIPEPSRII